MKHHALPEAFRFEAEYTTLANDAQGNHGGILWDDMCVNYPPKCRDQGLQMAFLRHGESCSQASRT